MTDPALARKIETTGWSTVVLGVVCVGLAVAQAVLPGLLDRLAASLPSQDDPTRAMREAWSSGAGDTAWVNGAFGGALIAIGVGVARRVRWAHPALTLASWASVAVLVVLAEPTLAPFVATAGGGEGARIGMFAVAAGLLVAQVAAVLWFLRFWRTPEVRRAFHGGSL
jgi:hypothetical protein